jgi:hypothetical protein
MGEKAARGNLAAAIDGASTTGKTLLKNESHTEMLEELGQFRIRSAWSLRESFLQ